MLISSLIRLSLNWHGCLDLCIM